MKNIFNWLKDLLIMPKEGRLEQIVGGVIVVVVYCIVLGLQLWLGFIVFKAVHLYVHRGMQ